MKRFLILVFAASFALAHPALGQSDFVSAITERVEAEGFHVIEVKRTWLGRILILSDNGQFQREIVLNRTSGEILRDKLFAVKDPSAQSGQSTPGKTPGGSSQQGSPGPHQGRWK